MHVKWNTVEVAEFCEEHHCSCAFWILAGLNVQVLVQRSSVHVDAVKLLQAKLALPVCNLDDIIANRSGFLCYLQTDRFQHTRKHSESATERLKLKKKTKAFSLRCFLVMCKEKMELALNQYAKLMYDASME